MFLVMFRMVRFWGSWHECTHVQGDIQFIHTTHGESVHDSVFYGSTELSYFFIFHKTWLLLFFPLYEKGQLLCRLNMLGFCCDQWDKQLQFMMFLCTFGQQLNQQRLRSNRSVFCTLIKLQCKFQVIVVDYRSHQHD